MLGPNILPFFSVTLDLLLQNAFKSMVVVYMTCSKNLLSKTAQNKILILHMALTRVLATRIL